MTRDAELIGLVEQYLDEFEGITPLPVALRDRVRAKLPHTKQVRPAVGLARFSQMSNPFKIGMAAAVLGAAALIGFLYYQQGNPPGNNRSPSPTVAANAAVPDELRHPFLGPMRDIPGVPVLDQTVMVFDDLAVSIEYGGSGRALQSMVFAAGPGKLRLVSATAEACDNGAAGTYSYSFTPGGSMLTLQADAETCAARKTALEGTWERSNCRSPDNWCLGVLEAGTYSSHYFEPRPRRAWHPRYGAFTFQVPDGWAAYTDYPDAYGLAPAASYTAVPGNECYDCSGKNSAVTVLASPRAATQDCKETNDTSVGGTIDDIAAWLTHHPGLVASAQNATVNGYRAIELDMRVADSWTGTCGNKQDGFVAVPIFYHQGSYHWAFPKGDRWHMYLVDLGSGETIAVVVDTDPAQLDAFVTETRPMIDTFTFPEP